MAYLLGNRVILEAREDELIAWCCVNGVVAIDVGDSHVLLALHLDDATYYWLVAACLCHLSDDGLGSCLSVPIGIFFLLDDDGFALDLAN